MYITFFSCSLWSRIYLPYLPCFSDMHTTFFALLSLEQALSTLSTMFFGHAYHFFCLALFGAGSIYPIYHVFWTCIPLFGLLSLEQALSTLSAMGSRYRHTSSVLGLYHFEVELLSTYLPCFLDMYITFF